MSEQEDIQDTTEDPESVNVQKRAQVQGAGDLPVDTEGGCSQQENAQVGQDEDLEEPEHLDQVEAAAKQRAQEWEEQVKFFAQLKEEEE